MLLVGFHGGSDKHHVAAYQDHGARIAAVALAPDPAGLEPRALGVVAPGLLWVVDGSKDGSAILAFTGSRVPYAATDSAVVAYPAVDSLLHPFDFTFSEDFCYVSNQDTNVVARFTVAADRRSLTPAPIAPALPDGSFLAGTFVASANGTLPHVPATTPVPASDGGLEVTFDSDGKVAHSVRGVAAYGGLLYVADEPGDAVKVYDGDGTFLGASDKITAPVHLLPAGDALYASGKHGVFHAHVHPKHPAKLKFHQVLDLPGAAGMAFGKGTDFYVANRTGKTVSVYRDFSDKHPGTPDNWPVPAAPEFLLHLDGSG